MVTGAFFARAAALARWNSFFKEPGRRDRNRIRDDRRPLPGTALRDLSDRAYLFRSRAVAGGHPDRKPRDIDAIGRRRPHLRNLPAKLCLSSDERDVHLRQFANGPAKPGELDQASLLDVGNFYNNAANTQGTAITLPAAGAIAVVRILYPMSQMAAIVGGTALQAGRSARSPRAKRPSADNRDGADGIYAFRVEP